jgi:predicted ATP-dependent serine protease
MTFGPQAADALRDVDLFRDPPQSGSSSKCELNTVLASEVTPKKIEWIWQGRIALGKQTLIAGEPGVGKSQVIDSIVAPSQREAHSRATKAKLH